MSNDIFDRQLLAEKLLKLNNSQQSIESLSHWCISHRKRAKEIVETWDKLFNASQKEQRVSFLYLANDILQNSRRKGSEFVNEFWKVLPAALRHVYESGDEDGRKAVTRLVDIWEERKVFGSRGQGLKDDVMGKNPLPSASNGKSSNSIKIVKRDAHSVRIKLAVGGLPEKILTAFQPILDQHLNEEASLNNCSAAVREVGKVVEDVENTLAQEMASSGPAISFPGTPIITTAKLNWKNYLSWSASVELWFLGQGHHDHLENSAEAVPIDKRPEWEKLDYQLCAVLWQSVEPDVLEILRSFKTCCSFWKKAREIFANDIQSLFDATMKVTTLKQTSHDMIAHIGKARAAMEELKRFLVADSLEEVNRKLDKFYMVLILRSLHFDFDHVRDQVLAGDQVPSMDSLITRLLCVSHALKEENPADTVETSAMVAPHGRGGGRNSRGGRSGRGGRPQCTYCKRMGHTQENCYSLHGFPDKVAKVAQTEKSESKFSDEEYQEYLKLKSEKSSSQTSSSSVPCYSTACISQSIDGPSPWILDSGASNHISGTWHESTDWKRM
ncbi:uncharacterized protein LOC114405702 isoform X1 [Glycine soja]|uniref:uncharacterized protein isoform X2 n=1 Tax=Glycine max TaxID=3847 RepID=UPI0007192B06|nr:uncharacterized protein LOC100814308 isoform X2 [Glycine max]XP_028223963.1 uncharacterized protein LOC114405702 isoform X1 [Glycine soja]XP_028223965.1 uncharacterized protein LOC114405702 isoform X1 [Glycine soja]|eukprot:XP_014628883.1 uncharacterized protein LOC100814308 isoform X1 [Glycine max]